MIANPMLSRRLRAVPWGSLRRIWPSITLFTLLILFPVLASAQTPLDTGFTALQTLFTSTVAKVASLIAIVVGSYQFAHGEPGAKKYFTPPALIQTIVDVMQSMRSDGRTHTEG